MRHVGTVCVAILCSVSQSARAETRLVSDEDARKICEAVRAELTAVGIDAATAHIDRKTARARRRAFAGETVTALAVCRSKPNRIEVFYPDGSRQGMFAFSVPAQNDMADATVYASERIRSERYIADVPAPVPFAPALWWLGVGADTLFSPGGLAPVALISVDVGYRFHRHWSIGGFASIQPYRRSLSEGGLSIRARLDQFGGSLSYHPLVRPKVDLAISAHESAVRLGVSGTPSAANSSLQGQRDARWLAFPAGALALRIGLSPRIWLRMQGEAGALLPRTTASGGNVSFGSIGVFAARAGIGLEVHFR